MSQTHAAAWGKQQDQRVQYSSSFRVNSAWHLLLLDKNVSGVTIISLNPTSSLDAVWRLKAFLTAKNTWKFRKKDAEFTFRVQQRRPRTAGHLSLWSIWSGCERDLCSPAHDEICRAAWWSHPDVSPPYPGLSAQSQLQSHPLEEGRGRSSP